MLLCLEPNITSRHFYISRTLVRSDVLSTKKLVILISGIQVALDNYENESTFDPITQQVGFDFHCT